MKLLNYILKSSHLHAKYILRYTLCSQTTNEVDIKHIEEEISVHLVTDMYMNNLGILCYCDMIMFEGTHLK